MKEMRFRGAGGEWWVAIAFDPTREAVLLVADNQSGGNERRRRIEERAAELIAVQRQVN